MNPLRSRGPVRWLLHLLLATVVIALPLAGQAEAATSEAESEAASAGVQTADTDSPIPNPLRVGTEGVYAPFSVRQGEEFSGFDIEVMNAVAQRLGVEVEYVATPWDSMFAALESNRFDLVANQVTFNEEREQIYDLSEPYVETGGVLVVSEDNPENIETLEDLDGKRSAQNLTSSWAGVAEEYGAQIVGVDGMTEAIANLEQGRADALVNDKLAVRNYIATNPNAKVEIVDETDETSQTVFAARKDSGYMPAINDAIAELEADGTIQTIYDKYFSAQNTAPSWWELVKDNAGPIALAAIKVTIPLAAISFAIGLALALGVAMARMSHAIVPRSLARAFISIIRGTPLLVQLYLIFYGLPQMGVELPPFPAAVIALSLNVAGYAAEVIRAAIESIPQGQWEAAQTVGMNRTTALRRVILPQAARTAIPPLSNTLISLVKDTSLASIILVVELLRTAQFAAAPTFQFMALYGLAAVYYWIICLALSILQDRAEARLSVYVDGKSKPVESSRPMDESAGRIGVQHA